MSTIHRWKFPFGSWFFSSSSSMLTILTITLLNLRLFILQSIASFQRYFSLIKQVLRSSIRCDMLPCHIYKYFECQLLPSLFQVVYSFHFSVWSPDFLVISAQNAMRRDNDEWPEEWTCVLLTAKQSAPCWSLKLFGLKVPWNSASFVIFQDFRVFWFLSFM